MRYFLAVAVPFIACAGIAPVYAASDMTAFSVRATVIGSCTITPGRLVSSQTVTNGTSAVVCAQAAPSSTIASPQPVVTVSRDAANGIATLLIEF